MGQSSTPKWGMCCQQNWKRPTKHCASFSVMGGARNNNLIFLLRKGLSLHAPCPRTLGNFIEIEASWILVGHSPSSDVYMLYQYWSIQHFVIMGWTSVIFYRKDAWSRSPRTKLRYSSADGCADGGDPLELETSVRFLERMWLFSALVPRICLRLNWKKKW